MDDMVTISKSEFARALAAFYCAYEEENGRILSDEKARTVYFYTISEAEEIITTIKESR